VSAQQLRLSGHHSERSDPRDSPRNGPSLNHLIGTHEQRRRNREAEHRCNLAVDQELGCVSSRPRVQRAPPPRDAADQCRPDNVPPIRRGSTCRPASAARRRAESRSPRPGSPSGRVPRSRQARQRAQPGDRQPLGVDGSFEARDGNRVGIASTLCPEMTCLLDSPSCHLG